MNNTDLFHELEVSQTLIDYSDTLFSCHRLNGEFTYASPSFLKFFGYQQEELVDAPLVDFLHPQDKPILEKLDLTQPHEKRHYRFCRKEGDYVWLEIALVPRMANDQPNGFICISRDITEIVAAKVKQEEHKEKYRRLVEKFIDTVGIITKDGHMIYMNEAGKKLFGVTRKEEIIGSSVFGFLHPESSQALKDLLRQDVLSDTLELTVTRDDGQMKYVMVQLIPTAYKGRETFQIIIRDLTDQKKAEETIVRTGKLSVVGQLAAGIAHEIRNPLTTVKGFIQLLSQEGDNRYLEVVLDELERMERIVSDLVILAKPQPSNPKRLDLKALLENTNTFFQSEALLHNITIQSEINLAESFVEGEENKLKQVFINILKNAVEAMPDGGEIHVCAEKLKGEQVIIKFKDNGMGISEERIKRLGEPFFTTKEKGTGLGLMICRRIIKNHGGSIEFESVLNEGTTVNVFLPIKN